MMDGEVKGRAVAEDDAGPAEACREVGGMWAELVVTDEGSEDRSSTSTVGSKPVSSKPSSSSSSSIPTSSSIRSISSVSGCTDEVSCHDVQGRTVHSSQDTDKD